eukprot:1177389-Prorocentrum_minimum.AAC.2
MTLVRARDGSNIRAADAQCGHWGALRGWLRSTIVALLPGVPIRSREDGSRHLVGQVSKISKKLS